MTRNKNKRIENVKEMINSFMNYFIFHGVCFTVLSVQNYIHYDPG